MSERVVPESAIDERLREISTQIERLEAEREALLDLLKSRSVDGGKFAKAVSKKSRRSKREREQIEARLSRHRRPTPKKAVRATVRMHPGWRRKQIVDRLEGVVDSDADDVRAVIYTAMRRLEEDGEIVRVDDRVFPADHPKVRRRRRTAPDSTPERKRSLKRKKIEEALKRKREARKETQE